MAAPNQVQEQVILAGMRTKNAADRLAERFGRTESIPDTWPSDSVHGSAVAAASIATLAETMVKLADKVESLEREVSSLRAVAHVQAAR